VGRVAGGLCPLTRLLGQRLLERPDDLVEGGASGGLRDNISDDYISDELDLPNWRGERRPARHDPSSLTPGSSLMKSSVNE
jgi:hypothetical protein